MSGTTETAQKHDINPKKSMADLLLCDSHYMSGIHTALTRVSGTDFHQDQISDASRQTECLSASVCCQNAPAHARGVMCFSEAAAAPESSWVE